MSESKKELLENENAKEKNDTSKVCDDAKNDSIVEKMANNVENDFDKKVDENKKPFEAKQYFALHLINMVPVPGINIKCDLINGVEIEGLKKAYNNGDRIIVVSTVQPDQVPKKAEDIFGYGCLAQVKRVINESNGSIKAIVDCYARAKIESVEIVDGMFIVSAIELEDVNAVSAMAFQKCAELKKKCRDANKFDRFIPPEIEAQIVHTELPPAQYSDRLVHLLTKEIKEQQLLLSEVDVEARLDILMAQLEKHINTLMWRKEIDDKVSANINKSQKEMFLREQLHVINEELNGDVDEVEDFTNKVKALNLKPEVEEKVLKEVRKLGKLPFGSPEIGYVRNFVETVLELPWNEKTEDNIDIVKAKKILDKEHYALCKVKERILECLAVMKLTGKVSAQIICLVGPPGVGKTSIAKSIANAMERKFVQVSLGGVSDESVIRGHRRTYVGAMCGRILAGMKQAKTINPVFLLDEIDKLGKDIHGDPASALLEVLDPAQNDRFKDNFLEVPYDLSQVLFITTANSLETIPQPLLDRMEVIELRSYTEFEKIEIAKKYLIEKQEKLCGLKPKTVLLDDELLSQIIREYTYEAGVRGLERQISKICRKYAKDIVAEKEPTAVTSKNLRDFLGTDYVHEYKIFQGGNVGEVVGLAVSSNGIGSCLLVEAIYETGSGKVLLTGQLGKVAQESANAAYSLIKKHSTELKIDVDFNKVDLHIHIPAMPYGVEGPSAGIATTVAIASAFTGRKVKAGIAMTGEVSLRGRVLPVGGVRDKLIGANRAGIKTVILPKDNENELKKLPKAVKDNMEILLVDDIKDVLELSLQK